jgi:hypothetical protein
LEKIIQFDKKKKKKEKDMGVFGVKRGVQYWMTTDELKNKSLTFG